MRALEQINFQKLYLLCKNFAENSCHQMRVRRTCFAAKQAFESEYALKSQAQLQEREAGKKKEEEEVVVVVVVV